MKKVKKYLVILLLLMLTAAVTGCGRPKIHEVSFNGCEAAAQKVPEGEKAIRPEVFKENHTLENWYTDAELTNEYDFDNPVKADIVLFPKWVEDCYKIRYVTGSDAPAPVQSDVAVGDSFTLAEAPERDGYEFLGWSDGIDVFRSGTSYVLRAENVVLTAMWEYKEIRAVFYDGDGKKISTESVPYGGNAVGPDDIETPNFCFEFSGWDKPLTALTQDTDFNPISEYVPSSESLFSFSYHADTNSYSIKAKTPLMGALALPTEHNGLPVTKVDNEGFAYGMTGTVYVPFSYRELGRAAFFRCSLKNIYIEEGLEKICPNALADNDLNYFNIPSSVQIIERQALAASGTTKTIVEVSADNENYVWDAADKLLYTSDRKTIVFAHPSIENLFIKAGVEHLYPNVCAWSKSLKSVVVAGHVKTIGAGAFMYCTNLQRFTINGSVETLMGLEDEDTDYNGNFSGFQGVFNQCVSLTELNFPAGLKHIGRGSFSTETEVGLKITLPDTVEYIGIDAFVSSSEAEYTPEAVIELTDMTSVNGKYIIENGAVIEKNNDGDTLLYYASGAEANIYEMPDSVVSVMPFAFAYNRFIEEIIVSGSVAYFPASMCLSASNLKKINVPAAVTAFDDGRLRPDLFRWPGSSSLIWAGQGRLMVGPFYDCSSLNNLEYEKNSKLNTICGSAFSRTALNTLFIPASVDLLYALDSNCSAYEVESGNANYMSVDGVLFSADMTTLYSYPKNKTGNTYTTPDEVERTAQNAFSLNTELDEVVFAEGFLSLGQHTFNTCYKPIYNEDWELVGTEGIERVVFPSTLNSVGLGAFRGCSNLKSLTFNGSVPIIAENITNDKNNNLFPSNVSDDMKVNVLVQYKRDYYFALFKQSLQKYLSGEELGKITYSFDSHGGAEVSDIVDYVIAEIPMTSKPDNLENHFFQGWYLTDSSGNLTEKVSFPFMSETDVTLHAKWGNSRYEDGSRPEFAISVDEWIVRRFERPETVFFSIIANTGALYVKLPSTLTSLEYSLTITDSYGRDVYPSYDEKGAPFYELEKNAEYTVKLRIKPLNFKPSSIFLLFDFR